MKYIFTASPFAKGFTVIIWLNKVHPLEESYCTRAQYPKLPPAETPLTLILAQQIGWTENLWLTFFALKSPKNAAPSLMAL